MGSYSGIIEGLKDREAELRERIDEVRHAADTQIRDLTDEHGAVEEARKNAEQLERDFGGAETGSPPKVPTSAAPASPVGSRPKPAPPSDPNPNAGRAGRPKAENLQAVADVLRGKGWVKAAEVKNAVGMAKHRFERVVRETPQIEMKGWARSTMYRLVGDVNTEPLPPMPLPPIKTGTTRPPSRTAAAKPADDLSSLHKQVFEYIRRHPNQTDPEIARGLGRGTKAGMREISAVIHELGSPRLGKISYADHDHKRHWRPANTPPPKFGAPVQTKGADGITGERSPHSQLERDIIAAVKEGPKSIPEIAEEIKARKESVSQAAMAMASRKILVRGIKGTETVYGVAK